MPRPRQSTANAIADTVGEPRTSRSVSRSTQYENMSPQNKGCCRQRLWTAFTILIGLLITLSIVGFHVYCETKVYLTTSEEIASISEKFIPIGHVLEEPFAKEVAAALRKRFPGHILADDELQWIFFNIRGWIGAVCVLHASITEYILLFRTGIDTPGRTGRYWANVSDTILTGSFRQWKEGQHRNTIFYAGHTVFHGYGEMAAEQIDAGTWMMEYGRGYMPSTLGFTLADTIFSTNEYATLFKVYSIMGRCLFNEMMLFYNTWNTCNTTQAY